MTTRPKITLANDALPSYPGQKPTAHGYEATVQEYTKYMAWLKDQMNKTKDPAVKQELQTEWYTAQDERRELRIPNY